MKSKTIIWLVVGLLWTVLIIAFTVQAHQNSYATILKLATVEATSSFNKDLVYRRWATSHGGVYAPITKGTPPSPYLKEVPERDIETPSGRKLTLINPAYMTRQVQEMAEDQYGIKGHLTSLDPIRPENKPDNWETVSLASFEQGATSVQEVTEIDGEKYLRSMYPMITEKGCLKCHAGQGYKLGDIRGGVSVSVPLKPYLAIHNATSPKRYVNFLAIWLLGITTLAVVRSKVSRDFSAVQANLSKEKKLSAELEQQKVVWQKAQKIGAIGGWTIDIVSETIEWSDETYRIFGVPPDTRIDYQTFLENVHPDDRDLIKQEWEGALRGKPYDINHRLIVDDQIKWVREKADIQFDENVTPLSAIGFVQDITEQKKAETALREMDRMKNEFISTAAHELRTPLAAMMGFTEFLMTPETFGGFTEDQKKDFLATVYDRGESLSRIIDDLLDISRIDRGQLVALDLQKNDIKDVLSKVLESFRVHNTLHRFHLNISGQPGQSVIFIDRHRINQVLENLLSNAVKYSPEGSEVSVTGVALDHGWEIRVKDQGIGMNEEQTSRIFDKFYRADASNTAVRGLGLGMSIVRQIIEAHGGNIQVESAKEQGTTITCTLPYTAC